MQQFCISIHINCREFGKSNCNRTHTHSRANIVLFYTRAFPISVRTISWRQAHFGVSIIYSILHWWQKKKTISEKCCVPISIISISLAIAAIASAITFGNPWIETPHKQITVEIISNMCCWSMITKHPRTTYTHTLKSHMSVRMCCDDTVDMRKNDKWTLIEIKNRNKWWIWPLFSIKLETRETQLIWILFYFIVRF